MAINPIERRTRNSLITGLLIGGVIAIIVGGISFMQITKLSGEIKKEKSKVKQVYVAARDIKANNEIKPEDLTLEGLKKGEYRTLTIHEVKRLINKAKNGEK